MTVRNSGWLYLGLILILTGLVYVRSLGYGPVNWDNQLTGSLYYQESLEFDTFRSILTPDFSGSYQPVRNSVTALLAPFGARGEWYPYHLVSLGFYLATIVVLFLCLLNLFAGLGEVWPLEQRLFAVVTATAVFALHPGHVETVAWVSGQKDVLVGFFYLLSFYFYSRRERPTLVDLVLAILAYFLALGSKPSAVSLPLVLVAYDWLFRRHEGEKLLTGRRLAVYAVLFLPAVAAGVYFSFTTTRTGEIFPSSGAWLIRVGKVAGALVFSLFKLLLPVNLCLRYPEFSFSGAGDVTIYLYLAGAAALAAWAGRSLAGKRPYALFLFWFVAALLPNANLVPIVIERADRYYYLSSIGFSALAGYAAARLHAISAGKRNKVTGLVLAATLLLGLIAWRQTACWSNGVTAWKKVSALYPGMTLGRVGLGHSYLMAGDYDNALRTYKPLLEQARPNTEAILGAVSVLLRKDDHRKAIDLLKLGRALNPKNRDFLAQLARMYVEDRDTVEAEKVIGAWLEYYPESPVAQGMLAQLRLVQGRSREAIEYFQRAIEREPETPEYYIALARVLADSGRVEEAESLLLKALGIGIRTRTTRLDLAALYAGHGREEEALAIYSRYPLDELDQRGLEFMGARYFAGNQPELAIRCFRAMAERDSTLARAFNNQAVVYERLGSHRPADSLYLRALALEPEYLDAHFNRGNLLRGVGNLSGALFHYRVADSLAGGKDPAVLRSLAEVQAALGDSAESGRAAARLRRMNR